MTQKSLIPRLLGLSIAVSGMAAAPSASAADAFDPMNAWDVRGGTTGMMYFKMPFHADKNEPGTQYGLALAQQPVNGRSRDLHLMFDSPQLMNISFTGSHLNDFTLANRSLLPSRMDGPEGQRHSILGMGDAGWFVAAGAVALAAFGIAEIADSDSVDDPDPD